MEKFSFFIVKYKYDECPVCFSRDPDAGIAFVADILDPREMRNLAIHYEMTSVYEKAGRFIGSMYTSKVEHRVDTVLFCERVWQPLKADGTFVIYNHNVYNSTEKQIANFMLDQDPLIRDYANRVYDFRKNFGFKND